MFKQFRFPARYRDRSLTTLASVFSALTFAGYLVYVWMLQPEYWQLYCALIPAIPFLALWPGIRPDLTFRFSKLKDPDLQALQVLVRVWALGCTFEITRLDPPEIVEIALKLIALYLVISISWRSIVGCVLILFTPRDTWVIVLDNIRYLAAKHPVHRMVEAAYRANRDLTARERLAWELYLADITTMRPPPREITEHARARLLAFRAWLRAEQQLAEGTVVSLRQWRLIRQARDSRRDGGGA